MSEWDKLCELMTDLAELYKFTNVWGRTKAEGDKLQKENKQLADEREACTENNWNKKQKLEAIREITEDHGQTVYSLKHRIWEVLDR